MNTTLMFLKVFSMLSTSPFYTIHKGNIKIQTELVNAHISKSNTNIIYSMSTNHKSIFRNSYFTKIINTPIYFHSDDQYQSCFLYQGYNYVPDSIISGKIIENQKAYFISECGNITMTRCLFRNCISENDGGALYIENDCYLIIHNTIFDHCSSSANFGGACLLVKKFNSNGINVNDEELKSMNIQYSCFQNCNGGPNLVGTSIFAAATNSIIYFVSTVNTQADQSLGAQIDIQSPHNMIENNNLTGANSKYTGGFEFRYSETGFYKFLSISSMNCMFSVAYTDINVLGLQLGLSNIFNVTLKRSPSLSDDEVYSGLVYIRFQSHDTTKGINLTRCCFIDNVFNSDDNDKPRIVSRSTWNGEIVLYKICLHECHYNCAQEMVAFIDSEGNSNVVIQHCYINASTLNEIYFLDLGECKGKVTADILIPTTNYFSKSDEFSKSSEFSITSEFSYSNIFTKSSEFTSSPMATQSKIPTQSFKNSISISMTNVLTYTNIKSVTFSIDFYRSNSFTIIMENDETKVVAVETDYSSYMPYIIHYLSPTYVQSEVIHEIIFKKNKLNQQQIIGIVCGSTAVFFIIIGIIILIKNRGFERKAFIEDSLDSESSDAAQAKEYLVNYDKRLKSTELDNWV